MQAMDKFLGKMQTCGGSGYRTRMLGINGLVGFSISVNHLPIADVRRQRHASITLQYGLPTGLVVQRSNRQVSAFQPRQDPQHRALPAFAILQRNGFTDLKKSPRFAQDFPTTIGGLA